MYHKSPTTGLTGALELVVLRIPPPVTLPVMATSPPMVAPPITFKLASDPIPPASIMTPPMLADVVLKLPAVTVIPAVLKKPSLMVVVRAVR